MSPERTGTIKFAIPKGRMHDEVRRLLDEAGVRVHGTERGYRPSIGLAGFEAKILKPRAIIEMLASGARDLGFAGLDWVEESGADLVELLDTGLNPVRLVAAVPDALAEDQRWQGQELVVASEYVSLTAHWIEGRGLAATILPSYGATEVLPPEDADCIVDNTASGSTLAANGLTIVDELMVSSTRLYASPAAMADPARCERIEGFAMLIASVLEARTRVMIELNVGDADLERVIEVLPCMREPTVARLHEASGYAVKAAVRRDELPSVIPQIKAHGGSDIVVTKPEQIVL